jgi:lysyl-tRNA synthetase class II
MPREYSNLEKVRLEKVDQLREQGIDPYPAHSERSQTNLEAIQAFEDSESSGGDQAVEATLVGRLRSMRPMGKITFAHIEDGTGRVQLFLRANDIGQEQLELFSRYFDLGDFVQASGEMFRTRTGEVSLRVNDFRMLAKAITPLPAAKDEMVDGQLVQHRKFAASFNLGQPSCAPCVILWIAMASWKLKPPFCSRYTVVLPRAHLSHTTTNSSKTFTCAYRLSCI